jgi:ribonucleotide monophosphatase NagD (HAD superfamily)
VPDGLRSGQSSPASGAQRRRGDRQPDLRPDPLHVEDGVEIIATLEAVPLRKVEVIVGRPSPITLQAALETMGLEASECILIGDRLETDIGMGRESGMTALVLTGVTDRKTLEASPVQPDYVFDGIADLEGLLR